MKKLHALSESIEGLGAEKFLHRVVDGVCFRKGSGKSFLDFCTDEDVVKNRIAFRDYEEALISCGTALIEDNEEKQAAVFGEYFAEGDVAGVLAIVRSRKDDLKKALDVAGTSILESELVDFDWKSVLTLSSDRLSHHRNPLLQLLLKIKKDGQTDQSHKEVSLELDAKELQALKGALVQANSAIRSLE